MALIIVFDPNATPNNILEVINSGSTDQYTGRSDVLINPSLANVQAVAQKYWKHVSGALEEMTAGEKTAVDAAELAALVAFVRQGAKDIVQAISDIGFLQRIFADIVKDEINVLRQRDRDRSTDVAAASTLANLKTLWAARSTLNDRTLAQLKTEMINRADTLTTDP